MQSYYFFRHTDVRKEDFCALRAKLEHFVLKNAIKREKTRTCSLYSEREHFIQIDVAPKGAKIILK